MIGGDDGPRRRRFMRTRQEQRDHGAVADAAGDRHRPARLLGESVDLAQAQSGALADFLGGVERLEHVRQDLGRNARCPVSAIRIATNSPRNPSSEALPLSVTGRTVMLSVPPFGMASRAFTARLRSASSNSLGSTLTAHALGRDDNLDLDVAAQRAADHLLDFGQPLGEIDHRRREHLPPRKCEELAGQALAALGGGGDHVEKARLLRLGHVAPQPLHAPAHDHQQIVEIVRDAAGQLADRFQPLRLPQRALRRFAPLGLVVKPAVRAAPAG